MVLTSRRKLAEYVAERLLLKDEAIITQLAALIIVEQRERETELIVRDVEGSLARRGVLVATIETAETITQKVRTEIVKLLKYPEVRLREIVTPELIGGVRIRTPDAVLDATIAQKLHALKSRKI